jgi:P27 family predicted phage terminase small subunit
MPGPPRKPTAILKLSGSPLADQREGEPVPPADAPERPEWLNKRQREGWDWLVGALAKMKLLTSADMPTIAGFAVAWGTFVEAVENIEVDGSTCEGSTGNLVQSPWVRIRNESMGQILRYAQQFGLSPAARARVKVTEQKAKADGKARFFQAG